MGPRAVFDLLSARAKNLARGLVTDDLVPRGLKENFVRPQGRIFQEMVVDKLVAVQVGGSYEHRGNSFECRQVRQLAEARGFHCEQASSGPVCVITSWRC